MADLIDSSLAFIQQSFNANDWNTKAAIENLKRYSESLSPLQNEIARRQREQAERLLQQASQITLITDIDKYNKFNEFGNLGLDSIGLSNSFKLIDDIIKDIQISRQWLKSYQNFLTNSQNFNQHEQLITLGKSILGRATELCPMRTGNLRRSGTLYDFKTYIIIAFEAPYATYVHENMAITHPLHQDSFNCGGRAKFLEIALQEFFPDRSVWVETTGVKGVYAKISINPLLIDYKHFGR